MYEENHHYDGCLELVKGELASVKVPNIEMVRTFEELSSKNYNGYFAIFIDVWNIFKLLKGIKDSSASMDSNDVGLEDTKDFDTLNGLSIFAHYTNNTSKLTEEENRLRDEKYTQVLQKFSFEKG